MQTISNNYNAVLSKTGKKYDFIYRNWDNEPAVSFDGYVDIAEETQFSSIQSQIISYQQLTEEQNMFIAVIASEAGREDQIYWEIVAHTIINRYHNPQDVFKEVKSIEDVITQTSRKGIKQYAGYKEGTYIEAMDYLNNRDGSNQHIEDIIKSVIPIYSGAAEDFIDGAQWYYSPISMIPKGSRPSWASAYTEVIIKGIDPNIMRVYKL